MREYLKSELISLEFWLLFTTLMAIPQDVEAKGTEHSTFLHLCI